MAPELSTASALRRDVFGLPVGGMWLARFLVLWLILMYSKSNRWAYLLLSRLGDVVLCDGMESA